MHDYRYREAYLFRRPDRPRRPWAVRWPNIAPGPDQPTHCVRAFPSQAAAKAFKRHVDRELNSLLAGQDRLWESAVEEYADALASTSVAYQVEVGRTLRHFRDLIRPVRLSDCTPAACDRFFQLRAQGLPAVAQRRGRRPAEPYGPAAQRKEYAYLHAFFELFLQRRALTVNPLTTVHKPAAPEREVIVPTDEQWTRLLAVLPDPALQLEDPQAWHLLILLAVVTGLDRDDLLALTWSDPPLRLGSADTGGCGLIAWRRTKSRRRGQPGPLNYIGLPPIVSDRLAVRLASLEPGHTHVFPWVHFQRGDWDRIRAAADYPFTFKTFRATAGTRRAEAAALEQAARQLGHSSPRLTERHYVADRRLALAMAQSLAVPALPPLPAYPWHARPQRRGRQPRYTAPSAARSAPSAAGGDPPAASGEASRSKPPAAPPPPPA